jgi:hypothetical protein
MNFFDIPRLGIWRTYTIFNTVRYSPHDLLTYPHVFGFYEEKG